jgi:hypothetical protein
MAKLRMRAVLSAITAGILITIGGCTDPSPLAKPTLEVGSGYEPIRIQMPVGGATFNRVAGLKAEKTIGTEGGILQMPGGHTLTFPAGALGEPTLIRGRVDSEYLLVDFEPHGIQFPRGREPLLTLSLQNADVSGFKSLTVTYVAGNQILEVLPTDVNVGAATANSRLKHFSGYLLSGGRSAAAN